MQLENVVEGFEKNKISIITYWMNNKDVIRLLESYDISKEYFVKEFAVNILNYYIGVARKTQQLGNCPTIEKLLEFLRFNNIKTEELFLLCSAFKNSLIAQMYKDNIASHELDKEINYLFEQNFAGILKRYSMSKSEQSFARLVNLADKNIIMSSTDVKGIITSVSQSFCDISGYTKEELIGKKHSIVRHPDMSDLVFEDLWETISNGHTWKGEIKNRKKDGGHYWVHATIEPHYEEGKIIGYDALRQDISAKKELEEQQHILIEQSKSAAMGEMISMIAHQWRQPLQAVSILVQKLPLTKMIEGELTDEVIEKVVDDVSMQLQYMSKTIDDFRNFFKPDKQKENTELKGLIQKTQDFLAYMLKVDSIEFAVIDKGDTTFSLHVNEVVQVLINIVKNARDAMVDKELGERNITITHSINEKNGIIEILDNAGGIPNEYKDKIFEPYFSTKKNKNGTGLGLYMSKKIIEQYCFGKISVKNHKDGALFKIELPRS